MANRVLSSSRRCRSGSLRTQLQSDTSTSNSAASASAPFEVLMVCTGNICRSPVAAEFLRQNPGISGRWRIRSAGLAAVVGADMHPLARKELQRRGVTPEVHSARSLADEHGSADLVLTMTVQQRDQLIRRFPRLALKVFTMTEFIALNHATMQRTQGGDPWAIVRSSARARSRLAAGDVVDITDPINGGADTHRDVYACLESLSQKVGRILESR